MTLNKCRITVLASGRGTNFRAIAEACAKEDYPARVVALITDNPQAGAREVARRFGVPDFCFPVAEKKGKLPAEVEEKITVKCRELETDLIALAGFMRILKGALLDAYCGRILNIHPALLPSFKGLHAQRQALEYGVKVAGCTVHFVDRSVDGGPIVMQATVPVGDDDDEDSLSRKILAQEHRIYVEAIRLFALGRLRVEGRRVRILGEGRSKEE